MVTLMSDGRQENYRREAAHLALLTLYLVKREAWRGAYEMCERRKAHQERWGRELYFGQRWP